MSTQIPTFLTGRKYLNCFIYPVTVTSAGLATDGSGVDIGAGGYFEEFELERNHNLTEISPTNAAMENYVATKETFTATLTEIRKADGTSAIETAIIATGWVKILVNTSADGTTVGQCYSVLAIVDSATLRSDVGKNTISVTVRPVGIAPYSGASTPSF